MIRTLDPNKKPVHTESGFTLVELMVVIFVIAILVAIAIPLLRGGIDQRAREMTDEANLHALNSATTVWSPLTRKTGTPAIILPKR